MTALTSCVCVCRQVSLLGDRVSTTTLDPEMSVGAIKIELARQMLTAEQRSSMDLVRACVV
jgi:hypothetical protein